MKYICPNCGEKCLSRTSGTMGGRFKSARFPRTCPECDAYITSQIQPENMDRSEAVIGPLFGGLTGIILFVLLGYMLYIQFVRGGYTLERENIHLLFIVSALVLCFVFLMAFTSYKRKKITFALVDSNHKKLLLHEDIKISLDTSHIKRPNTILYDYTTFDFCITGDKKIYPVMLMAQMLNYEVKYYTLTFLGKRNGIKLPAIEEGDTFSIVDYMGNGISGSVEKVFENKEA